MRWLSNSFLTLYGSPLLQSLVGLNAENADLHRRIERDVTREAIANRIRAELESAIDRGGVVEAFVRAVAYRPRADRGSG